MIKMAGRFVVAMARHQWAKWNGYEVITPAAMQGWRYAKCQACPYRDEDQCTRCGCLIFAKTALALEACPDNRWQRIWLKKM